MPLPMRRTNVVHRTQPARPIISNARKQIFALNHIGCAMATMIVVITVMRTLCIVHSARVHRTVSVVRIIAAFQLHGTVMATTIAVMVPTNHQSTVNQRDVHALAIYLPVTMAIVYRASISVMVTTIAWTTVTKMIDISAVSVADPVILYIYCSLTKPTNLSIASFVDDRKCDEETEFTCAENKSWGRSQCIPKKW